MPIKIEKPAYKCEHCGKLYQSYAWAEKHEPVCSKNPDNQRPCFSCQHLCKRVEDIYVDQFTGGPVRALFCRRLYKFVYPSSTDSVTIREPYYFEDHSNDPMPAECDQYEERDYSTYQESFDN